jgi:membrane protein YqaA with SNARE-associated domain
MFKLQGMLGLFTSVPGVFLLAALDSTFFFSLPLGIDAAVIFMAARGAGFAFTAPWIATAGSLLGAWLTFWVGAKVGDAGVQRFMPSRKVARIKRRIQNSGAITIAVLDLVPPPFPFSLFVLAAGAAGVDRKRFFVTLALCRLARFGGEAYLGMVYGQQVLRWFQSDVLQMVVIAFVAVAVAASLISLVRLQFSMKASRVR